MSVVKYFYDRCLNNLPINNFYSYKKSICKNCVNKKVKCDFCSKNFNSSNLSKHLKLKHNTSIKRTESKSTSNNRTENKSTSDNRTEKKVLPIIEQKIKVLPIIEQKVKVLPIIEQKVKVLPIIE